ncbi:MAG: hypothetical protein K0Q72_1231 [Armatimonadetes bacterium]|jgi:hypothetical protein|nr:hypothetical protein [Armatimonadota bacterium]
MIKINLLPPHIHQRKQVKIAVGIVVVMLIGEIAGVLAYREGPRKFFEDQTKLDGERKAALQLVQNVGSEAGTVLGGEQALGPKYNFITGMLDYNKMYPDLYARTAGYTYADATFLNLEASANQLKFDAYISDPADVARLMVGLSNSPDFASLPQISGVPDFNSAERKAREETLSASNISDSLIIGGVMPGADGAGGAGGYPGMGAPGGYPGGAGGYPGGAGGMGAGAYPGGMGAGGMGAGGYSGGAGGYPGGEGGMGGGGGGGSISLLKLEASKKKPRGFTVTVTCPLKTPISRPNYADSESQLGSSGGGGGGMMGGGYPGMGGMGGYPGR